MLNNSVIHFSDAALIAVHALASLAKAGDSLVQTQVLAGAIGASEHHLAKVMQRLVRSRLVRSVKGPSGGFALARPAAEISFKEAIEAVDGRLEENFCPFSTDHCRPEFCIFGHEIADHSRQLIAYLEQRKISDIKAAWKPGT